MRENAGALTRELRVRVINVSRSGCLIESPRPIEIGTVGRLQLRFGSEEYGDDVQVVRSQRIRGAGPVVHIGLRFLRTPSHHAGTIRYGVRRRVAMLFEKHKGRVM